MQAAFSMLRNWEISLLSAEHNMARIRNLWVLVSSFPSVSSLSLAALSLLGGPSALGTNAEARVGDTRHNCADKPGYRMSQNSMPLRHIADKRLTKYTAKQERFLKKKKQPASPKLALKIIIK